MTDHPTYDPYEVPEAPGDDSRFAHLNTTPAGWAKGGPGGVMAHVFASLVEDRLRDSQANAPAQIEVKLKAAVYRPDGYRLAERGVVSAAPQYSPRRPGARWRKLSDGKLLDSFFVGQDAWASAPDLEVFEALLQTAERIGITGDDLRDLNNAVARAVCLRAGIVVPVENLPNVE